MSDAGDIVDAISSDATTSISGATVEKQATSVEGRDHEFPLVQILNTDYDVDTLDWRQETRRWTIKGAVWIVAEGNTRDTMQAHLEAFRDQIALDPTLGGAVDYSTIVLAVPESHSDSPRIAGFFEVRAELVV